MTKRGSPNDALVAQKFLSLCEWQDKHDLVDDNRMIATQGSPVGEGTHISTAEPHAFQVT
ncbi:uncharacterized protein PHALS_09230 [Plasmopara halstedii]|uniref:Uncharacterized protein n=1 Tax=Plasmopara halstedii TaxID=4781 RepID=A0A0P1AET7_PLAHL|nr:uncharacterized protein PHALS_09230 [Plasmopara halstedii]CEG39175.1 hypothetical protein PHALS_09230 [Plasmopara halstedii]|eukprot:XP_024575544.1 hypothetical protein PHALS_09230 [Plasmopara halstedii]